MSEIVKQGTAAVIESVVIQGDLAKLTPAERINYYKAVCSSVGLNPLTKPFDYINLNGKLTLYARKDATDQLRQIHGISTAIQSQEIVSDVYVVTTKAHNKESREDTDIGAVSIKGFAGDKLANAMMKAVTKSKRRVTLSICGLGFLDETEIETIPDAEYVPVEETGEIVEPEPVTNGRPYPPEKVKEGILSRAEKGSSFQPSAAQLNLLRYGLELCFTGDDAMEDKRHTLLNYIAGDPSTLKVDGPVFKAIVEDWLKMKQDSGDAWQVDPMAVLEAQAIVAAA